MPFQKTTIASLVENIENNKFYLPAIQRRFVWKEEQIIRLMDSIMRGYPFGTFLFWETTKELINEKDYPLYKFIKDYHERDNFENEPAGQPFSLVTGDNTIFSVLDGQQRLTALYIVLKGSVSYHSFKKRKSKDKSYPKKELYLGLINSEIDVVDDDKYVFKFLSDDEITSESNNGNVYFKVKEILKIKDLASLNKLMLDKGWASDSHISDNLSTLFERINKDELIDYFVAKYDNMDDVLDIFVRVNSGGTVLSKTDLLFSTIVSQWQEARDEINGFLKEINRIGDGYSFYNDFIMRTCLYVLNLSFSLKVESFGTNNVTLIKNSWKQIKEAIKETIDLISELGINEDCLVSENAIIPIVYYRYKEGVSAFKNSGGSNVLNEVKKYIVVSQINRIFGQSTNTALNTIRNEMEKWKKGCKFMLSSLQNLSFGDRNLKYDAQSIENWLDTYEKGSYTFMLLSMLYPNIKYGQVNLHQDHMHPFSFFDSDERLKELDLPKDFKAKDGYIGILKHLRNTLPNLQLLEGLENEGKGSMPLDEWLLDQKNMDNVKYLPKMKNYKFKSFLSFYEKRKKMMLKDLEDKLL